MIPPPPRAACTNAVVASCVVDVPGAAVGADGDPVKVGEATSAPPAAETSFELSVMPPVRPLNAVTPNDRAPSAAETKAVVASCVVLVPAGAVGAAGRPVNCGLVSSAPSAAMMSPGIRDRKSTRLNSSHLGI